MKKGLIVFALALVGCGGSDDPPDLTGMYMIDTRTESRAIAGGAKATCVAEGPAVTGNSFVRIGIDNEFGGTLVYSLCNVADGTDCSEQFNSFHANGGKWEIGPATSAAFSGGLCTLYHSEGSATAPADGKLRLEIKTWRVNSSAPQSECTLEAADDLSSSPDCDEHIVITATKVP